MFWDIFNLLPISANVSSPHILRVITVANFSGRLLSACSRYLRASSSALDVLNQGSENSPYWIILSFSDFSSRLLRLSSFLPRSMAHRLMLVYMYGSQAA